MKILIDCKIFQTSWQRKRMVQILIFYSQRQVSWILSKTRIKWFKRVLQHEGCHFILRFIMITKYSFSNWLNYKPFRWPDAKKWVLIFKQRQHKPITWITAARILFKPSWNLAFREFLAFTRLKLYRDQKSSLLSPFSDMSIRLLYQNWRIV